MVNKSNIGMNQQSLTIDMTPFSRISPNVDLMQNQIYKNKTDDTNILRLKETQMIGSGKDETNKSRTIVQDMDKNLKNNSKKELNENEIYTIVMNIINRKRFKYSIGDIFKYILTCLCFRKLKLKKYVGSIEEWEKSMKKHYQFNEGEDKLFDELDVISILKSIRRVKLLTQSLLTQQQKTILRFQRKNIIESSSSSGDSDSNNKLDLMNMMESKNPMLRFTVYAKLKKIMNTYHDQTLTEIDRRILRGLFVKHLKDFDEDHRHTMS